MGVLEVLYARVRGGGFRARFGRGAQAQLGLHVVEIPGGLEVRLAGGDHPIAGA